MGHELQFLGHHYYTFSLSDQCLVVEKKIFKEIMHYHYKTYMTTPQQKNPCPGVMKFKILVDPFLVIITLHVVCLNRVPEKGRGILKK